MRSRLTHHLASCFGPLFQSLTLMEEDLDMRKRMMRILQILSKTESNCKQMLMADCASRLVLKISHPIPNDE